MLKKLFILGAFLMLFGGWTAVFAQETKESNLTLRQILLLQVPEDYALEASNVSWGVIHATIYGPIEYVSKIINPADSPEMVFIQIVRMLGSDLKGVSMYAVMGLPMPMLTAEANQATGEMEVAYQDAGLGISGEDLSKFFKKVKEEAIATMNLLKVFEEKDLAALVKTLGKKIDPKKATSL